MSLQTFLTLRQVDPPNPVFKFDFDLCLRNSTVRMINTALELTDTKKYFLRHSLSDGYYISVI